ncbi:MAG: protein translocase SEC61 complex subunit gamma [Candidatus Heimdallarchaeum aukensis]|uniref:Protein translocase subunit SecE n=2 Tax=Candidatus Heimdallarchaeum TaxID=3053649 RepID=A0A9Y1FNF7_9ARCH|nr:MAG: protein translocase SEC61 complex subunit gamma [Candidatus Heimdallarchaeum aukensis]UJG42613.1 MAG: protein translocase SEC61 complex subunit gamma [Candidatus Heimdallarchaeum endolithica]
MSKFINNTRSFVIRSRRLLRHAKKPSRRELSMTAKITALGIIVIGLIGWVLHLMFNVILDAINK